MGPIFTLGCGFHLKGRPVRSVGVSKQPENNHASSGSWPLF
ncbi:MAG TPA: hypothetical protein VMS77_07195 [Conexivisphaerales archaeon]|nr:hypothetical protein [Conexivisphaerales archaeon]